MRDGGADAGASILEHEDEVDVGAMPQLLGAFGPEVDDPSDPLGSERGETGIVLRRIQDDFATIAVHGRPTIHEPTRFVRLGSLESADAERTHGCRSVVGQVGTRLTTTDDVDRGSENRIDAGLALGHGVILAAR